MARVKVDLKTLAARERNLRDQLRALKKQGRAIERAERQARTERVAALAEKFGILHIPDTILAASFKKLAAENPPPTESAKNADTVEGAEEEEEARTQPTGHSDATTSLAHVAETAQAASVAAEGRKRWRIGG